MEDVCLYYWRVKNYQPDTHNKKNTYFVISYQIIPMKHLSFFLSLVIICQAATAQKIHFTDRSNKWVVGVSCRGQASYKLSYSGTVQANGHEYRKLEDLWIGRTIWLREDTTAGKIYCVDPNKFSAERVLYDYTLLPGDTMLLPDHQTKIWVTGIDSILINSQFYKIWYFFAPPGSYYPQVVIEGIGGSSEPLQFLNWNFYDDCSKNLSCFETGGHYVSIPNKTGITWGSSTYCLQQLTVSQTDHELKDLKVVPNPALKNAHIQLPYTIEEGKVDFYSSFGSIVASQVCTTTNQISIPNDLPAGPYFFYVTDIDNGKFGSGKFIKE